MGDIKGNSNIKCPSCGHGTFIYNKGRNQCAKCHSNILGEKPFNPWEDKPKLRDDGVVVRSDEQTMPDNKLNIKFPVSRYDKLRQEGYDMPPREKEQASVERFKSIFGPKEPPKPLWIYSYTIRFEMVRANSSFTQIDTIKKLSRLKLWLLRWILGWRLELQ